jgi:hypothetical protein
MASNLALGFAGAQPVSSSEALAGPNPAGSTSRVALSWAFLEAGRPRGHIWPTSVASI